MARFSTILLVIVSVFSTCLAKDSKEKIDWDKKYEELLKARPGIRKKVEAGDATKEQVIAWMKGGGDSKKKTGGKNYYGWQVDVKAPAGFHKAQEKVVFSGPQAGEQLPAFKTTGLRGTRKGKEFDPVQVADGKPLVLIFQDTSVVGMKGLLLTGGPLAQIAEKSRSGLKVCSVFLVDDPNAPELFEYDFLKEINGVVEMTISSDRRDGPGAYGLNRNVAMTVIVAKDGKVLHNFAFTQPMLYPDAHFMGAVAKAIDVKRETLVSWLTDRSSKKKYAPKKGYDSQKGGAKNSRGESSKEQKPKK